MAHQIKVLTTKPLHVEATLYTQDDYETFVRDLAMQWQLYNAHTIAVGGVRVRDDWEKQNRGGF